MRIVSTSEHKAIQELLEAPDVDIDSLSLRARYNAIALLLNKVERACPNMKDMPLTEKQAKRVKSEIAGLIRLTSSIKHSKAYLEFAQNMTDLTLERVASDTPLLSRIENWDTLNFRQRSEAAVLHNRHQTEAARECSGLPFTTSDFLFHAKDIAVNGSCAWYVRKNTKKRIQKIWVNTADHAPYSKSGSHTVSLVHHETIHHHSGQLGDIFLQGDFHLLGDLRHDAEMAAFCHIARATIPSILYKPYRAQAHEIVAKAEEHRFLAQLAPLIQARNPVSRRATTLAVA